MNDTKRWVYRIGSVMLLAAACLFVFLVWLEFSVNPGEQAERNEAIAEARAAWLAKDCRVADLVAYGPAYKDVENIIFFRETGITMDTPISRIREIGREQGPVPEQFSICVKDNVRCIYGKTAPWSHAEWACLDRNIYSFP